MNIGPPIVVSTHRAGYPPAVLVEISGHGGLRP